jgi:hypothetical protein
MPDQTKHPAPHRDQLARGREVGLRELGHDPEIAARAVGVLAAIEAMLVDDSGTPASATTAPLGPEMLGRLLAAGGGAYLVARILKEIELRQPNEPLAGQTTAELADRVVNFLGDEFRSDRNYGTGKLGWLDQLVTTLESAESGRDTAPIAAARQRPPLPDVVPQSTWPEAREITAALTDGPTGRNWSEMPDELGVVHALTGSRFRTELVGSTLTEWFGAPATPPALFGELRAAGLPAALLLHVCIAITLEHPGLVEVHLDDLIRAVGWTPRSTHERSTMRRRIWRWLTIYASARVIGERARRRPYRDSMTGENRRLVSRDSLLMVGGVELDEQQLELDGSEPPITVDLAAGAFPGRYRDNRRVLTYFGNVRALAAIPAGKPSGAWAQAIGLALNQHWREHAARADTDGMSAELPPITRQALLDTFPPSPTVYEVLRGPNPKRARDYFAQAIDLLTKHGVIGQFSEPDPIADRKGWANRWLAELVDARPSTDGSQAAASIALTAARIRGGSRAKPPNPA